MRLPIVMASAAAILFCTVASGNRWYAEPKVEERPVVERRLTCPDGYDLYELNRPYEWKGSGGSSTYVLTSPVVAGNISMSDEKGRTWQMGSTPDVNTHVCVKSDVKEKKSE